MKIVVIRSYDDQFCITTYILYIYKVILFLTKYYFYGFKFSFYHSINEKSLSFKLFISLSILYCISNYLLSQRWRKQKPFIYKMYLSQLSFENEVNLIRLNFLLFPNIMHIINSLECMTRL